MDINTLRARRPELADLDDNDIVDVVHSTYYSGRSRDEVAKALGVKPAAAPEQAPGVMGRIGDAAISAAKGAIAVPEAAVGLADMVTGGRVGKALQEGVDVGGVNLRFDPKGAKEALSEGVGVIPGYTQAQRRANQAVQDADGFVDTAAAALSNPSTVAQSIIESVPSMLGGGVIGRAVLKAAPKVGAVVAGAAGEGVLGAGSSAEQIRQETEDGRLTAGQAAIAGASGALTGGLSLVAGKVAKAFGIADVDTMLAAGSRNLAVKKGIVRSVLEGAASEGILEELPQSVQEQVAQNMALGKPLDTDVDQAAVMGMLSGAAMGGGANMLSKGPLERAVDKTPPPAPAPLALSAPETLMTAGADGTITPGFVQPGQFDAQPGEPGPREVGAAIGRPYSGDVTDVEARPVAAEGSQDATQAQDAGPAGAQQPAAMGEGAQLQEPQPATPLGAGDTGPTAGTAPAVGAPAEGGPGNADGSAQAQAPGPDGQSEGAIPAADGANAAGNNRPVAEGPSGDAGAARPAGDGAGAQGVSIQDLDGRGKARSEIQRSDQPAGPGEFSSLKEAEAYAAGQKKNGSSIPAVPVVREDGTFGVAAKGTPDYDVGLAQRAARELKAENAAAGVQDGDVLAGTGKPFAAKLPAMNYLKKNPEAGELVELPGKRFVIRKATDAAAAAPVVSQPAGDAAGRAPAETPRAEAPAAAPGDAPAAAGVPGAGNPGVEAAGLKTDEDFQKAALNIVRSSGKASIALVQRHLRIGYNHAARLVEGLELAGHVSPAKADGSREVLPPKAPDAKDMAAAGAKPLGGGWHAFPKAAGGLDIPRAEMPQIKMEHRGAFANFAAARGVKVEPAAEVDPSTLKPTQKEISLEKIGRALDTGGDRAILISADGHVLDGHHQWMAAVEKGEPVRAIRLDAPIADLVPLAREFPSSTAEGATDGGKDGVAVPVRPVQPEGVRGDADGVAPVASGPSSAGAAEVDARPAGVRRREKAVENFKARVAEGKAWYGTAEKAQEKIEDLGWTDTHEVKETAPRKFELVEKAAATNTPQPEAAAQAETGKPENPGAGNAETGAVDAPWSIDEEKALTDLIGTRSGVSTKDMGGHFVAEVTGGAARGAEWQRARGKTALSAKRALLASLQGAPEPLAATRAGAAAAAAAAPAAEPKAKPTRAQIDAAIDAGVPFIKEIKDGATLEVLTRQALENRAREDAKKNPAPPAAAPEKKPAPAAERGVVFSKLPDDMQDVLMSFFGEFGQEVPAQLNTKKIATSDFPDAPLADGVNDTRGVAYAEQMVGQKTPPVIVYGGKWLDGRHRVWAAKKGGAKTVEAIDIADYLPAGAMEVIEPIGDIGSKPAEPAKKPAAKKANPAKARAKADLMNALADLGDILGKNVKANIVPEQEQKLLPVLTRVLDAAFRLGYQSFKDSAKFALDQIRQHLGDESADALTIDHLQGAYIAMSGGKPGATSKKAVVNIEDKAEIEAHEAQPTEEDEDGPAARNLESASAPALAGKPAGEVRPAEEVGRAAEGSDRGGRGDGQQDENADGQRPVAGPGVGDGARAAPVPAAGAGSGRGDGAGRGVQPDARREQRARQLADARSRRAVGEGTGDNPAPNAPVQKAPQFVVEDFTIEDDFALGEGGEKTKFRANVEALELLARLRATQAQATPDEQKVLARYVGWGGLANAFEGGNPAWAKEQAELKALMSPEDYAAAARSTRYAHYTSREVIRDGIYAALDHFGFTGGKVLEGGAGVGNFIGLMPAGLRTAGRVTAVEREPIAAGIAQQLYPKQNVVQEDFTRFAGTDDYFDAAVGNPPFASDTQTDQAGRKHLNGLSLHNYFFAKEVDMLREGGILAQVVTNSFLDAKGDKARSYIADRTRFLGAIRLPNNAFSKNAGTEVTTDLIFLQKRPDSEWGTKAAKLEARAWLNTGKFRDSTGREVALNQYFIDHPEMMLGDFGAFGSMYREGSTALVARPGQDTAALLKEAVARLPKGVYTSAAVTGTDAQVSAAIVALKNPPVREGGFFLEGDKLIRREPDLGGEARGTVLTPETRWTEKTSLGEKGFDRIKKLSALRSTVRGLIAAEMANDDKGMGTLRAALNEQYDAYTADYGLINDKSALNLFGDDPDYPLLASLEQDYRPAIGVAAARSAGIKPQKSTAKKSPIFSRRVVAERKAVTKVDSPADALAVSMAERGRLDTRYIGEMLDQSPDEVLQALSTGDRPLLFKDPETGEYVLRDAYLSGNVRQKLATAKQARMFDNVRALEEVQPADIGSHEIVARIGSPWVPEKVYEAFAKELFGEGTEAQVRYTNANSSYGVYVSGGDQVAQTNKWGTPDYSGPALLNALLNNKTIAVRYKTKEGTVTDKDKTDLANTKAQDIRNRFADWLFADAARSDLLTRAYNDTNNNYVTRQYDGAFMTFPGKVPDEVIKFRRHQRNAIARIVQDRTALLDHVVGAGKTFTVISAMMELKRTGLASKPMVAVPNHLVKQWAADWYRLYPGANILTATKKDFEKANRRKFLAKIATGDWDAVIIAHSSYGFIKAAPEFEAKFNQKQIALVVEAIDSVEGSDATAKRTVKQLEGIKERLENRIKALREKPMDALLDFSEIGVDQLAVDEAHMFKNLMFSTKMQGVQGLGDPAGSQRAYDMFLKVNSIYEKNGRGQGVVFATGTPVSNSLAEMYHMMRYLMPAQMEELGFQSFDAWANTFASVEQVWMQSPSGDGYKPSNRMSNFVNTPELLKMFDQVSDTVTMDDIKGAYREENNREFPLPPLLGGRRSPMSIPKTPAQNAYMDALAERARVLEKRKGPPQKGDDNILVIMGDGRKAAMDIRLVDLDATEREKGGRIDVATDGVLERYRKFDSVKGTQLVFSDLGTPIKHAQAELKEYKALEAAVMDGESNETVLLASQGDDAAQDRVDAAQKARAELEAKGADWLDAVKAAERGFSVYDDFRAGLIEKGIPEAEIAFIHDYNTDDQKATLFRKVNAGEIRVVLGSTAKMGAGTNVQERLVALHHLDVPWRPSDIEQREGRIERQGNKLLDLIPGFHVEIVAYVTQDTLDMRMWQVQETKLKMINQLRTRKVGREVDNAFEAMEMSAGEMQAAATGNQDLLKEIQAKAAVKKLEQKKRAFDAQRSDLENRRKSNAQRLETLPVQIAAAGGIANAAKAYVERLSKINDGFKAEFNGTTYDNVDAYRAAIMEKFDERGPSTENDALGKPVPGKKVPLNVTMDGEQVTNREEMLHTLAEKAGDKRPIMWDFEGQTLKTRRGAQSAIASAVSTAINEETAVSAGEFAGFKVTIEGQTLPDSSRTLDMLMEGPGGIRLEREIEVTKPNAMLFSTDIPKAAGAIIETAEIEISRRSDEFDYLQGVLERVKKEKAELDKAETLGEWDGQPQLEAARAEHADILKRLAEADKKKETKPALRQDDDAPVAGDGSHVKALAATVAGIVDGWAMAPAVKVVADINDKAVPAEVRTEGAARVAAGGGAPQAVIHQGRVYLFANQLADDRAAVTALFHEVLGHFGLRSTFGDGLKDVLQRVSVLRPADVQKVLKRTGLADTAANRLQAAEEVLAYMAEKTPEIGFVQKALAAIRTWLRERAPFFAGLNLSDAELVRDYILPARRFVESGGPRGPGGGIDGTAFAVGADDVAFSQATGPATLGEPREVFRKAMAAANTRLSHPGTLGWWHKTFGTQYNLAQRSPAFKRVFDRVQDFIADISSYATAASNLAPTLLPQLDSWKDIVKKGAITAADSKAISAPIFQGTVAWKRDETGKAVPLGDREPVQEAGVVWTDKELRDQWKLTPEQIALYREFRAATDKSLSDLATATMLNLAGKDATEIRETVLGMDMPTAADTIARYLRSKGEAVQSRAGFYNDLAGRIEGTAEHATSMMEKGYAPLSRFGQYTVDAVDENGERLYFSLFESKGEANRMAAKLKADFPKADIQQGTVSQNEYKVFAGVAPETAELFGEFLGLDSEADGQAGAAFAEWIKLAKSNRSAMKRLLTRKGVSGYSEDASRVLAGFIYSNARQSSRNLHGGDIDREVLSIRQEDRNAGELADAAQALAEYVKTPQEEGQAVRGLLFAQYIGGSLASAAVNLTQPLTMTMPYLSQFGGIQKSIGTMKDAILDAVKKETGDKALDAAMKRAEDDGTVAPHETHQLQALAAGRAHLVSGDGTKAGEARAYASNKFSQLQHAWGKFFSMSELANRRVTFIAAYRTAVEQKLGDPEAFARKTIQETQGVYNKGNKPAWARGAIGGTLFTFKQFSISYVEMLHRMATQGTPEQKAAGRKAALFAVGMLFLLGGGSGLPFVEDAEDVADALAQRLGYNFSAKVARQRFLASLFGEAIGDFMDRGVSSLPGMPIDVSGRLGMGNLIPGTGLLLKKDDHTRDLLELAGPAGDLFSRGFQSASALADGQAGKAALLISPKAAANVMQAIDMASTGMYRDTKGRRVIDVNGWEALAKGIGFQPTAVAQVQEANFTQQRLIAQVRLQESEIANRWAEAAFKGDAAGVLDAKQEVKAWNDRNPDSPIVIKPTQILKRLKEMRKTKAERIAATAPKELRAGVRAALVEGNR